MSQPIKILSPIRLKDFNPDFHEGLDKDETREKTERLCHRICEMQELLHADARQALLIVFQGMDTSGKDGAAKRVLEFVNPAGVETSKPPRPRIWPMIFSGAFTRLFPDMATSECSIVPIMKRCLLCACSS